MDSQEQSDAAGGVPARTFGLWSASALVVANMVGTGVFTTSGFLLADLRTPGWVLLAWAVGGLLAMLGAVSYGALARRFPRSGGEYTFLSETLHPVAGQVAGWISLLVGFSAPLAAAAFAFGEYTRPWFPGLDSRIAGSALLAVFAVVHASHVQRGTWAQNAAVLLKLALIAGFIALAGPRLPAPPAPTAPGAFPWSAFPMALVWVSFSYSGWNAAVYIGSEVRDPERTLPRALVLATASVTGLYLLLNAVFLRAAPPEVLVGQAAIGRIAAGALGGPGWAEAVSALIALALVSSVSSMLMAGPRVYAAMAEDGYLPRALRADAGAPRAAIALQAILALAFLWTASFETLLTCIGFALSLCSAATVLGLMRLRLREGPGFHVPGWPWVPGGFVAGVLLLATLAFVNLALPGWRRLLQSLG